MYHRAIAAGDYVYTHGVFYNFVDDDPDDHGMAVVDIFRMDEEGKAAEHWDVLQLVGDPKSNVAPPFGPAVFGKPVPAQNPNGMVEEARTKWWTRRPSPAGSQRPLVGARTAWPRSGAG